MLQSVLARKLKGQGTGPFDKVQPISVSAVSRGRSKHRICMLV